MIRKTPPNATIKAAQRAVGPLQRHGHRDRHDLCADGFSLFPAEPILRTVQRDHGGRRNIGGAVAGQAGS
jgi:hypothetical protein